MADYHRTTTHTKLDADKLLKLQNDIDCWKIAAGLTTAGETVQYSLSVAMKLRDNSGQTLIQVEKEALQLSNSIPPSSRCADGVRCSCLCGLAALDRRIARVIGCGGSCCDI